VSDDKDAIRRWLEALLRFVVPVGTVIVLMFGCPEALQRRTPPEPPVMSAPTFPTVPPTIVFWLDPIHFETNRADLDATGTETLATNLARLRSMSSPAVTIVAHCDERGTDEHNKGLAQHRASTARDYLLEHGYEGLLYTMPVGRAKAFCAESEEACWKRNRRVDLLVHP
jgi:outer membrane protein OmpA-like peptidoglycan-associated protein